MKIKILITLALIVLTVFNTFAQQALWGAPGLISPEVKDNNTVIFRYEAPKAREVRITGDWMPMQGWVRSSEAMARDEKGVWSYTTQVLPSDLYSYSFTADSLQLLTRITFTWSAM